MSFLDRWRDPVAVAYREARKAGNLNHYARTTRVGSLTARFRAGCSCGWKGDGVWLEGDDAFQEAWVHARNAEYRAAERRASVVTSERQRSDPAAPPTPERVAPDKIEKLCDE